MPKKRHTAEEIITKLREAEVLQGKGQSITEACRQLNISEQTYYKWRKVTHYTVTIQPGFKGINGRGMDSTYSFSFTTIPFQIDRVESYPGDFNVKVGRDVTLSFGFTGRIDTATVRSAFQIAPSVRGRLIFAPCSIGENCFYGFQFKPDSALPPNTVYTVSVAQSLRSIAGFPLATSYLATFETGSGY